MASRRGSSPEVEIVKEIQTKKRSGPSKNGASMEPLNTRSSSRSPHSDATTMAPPNLRRTTRGSTTTMQRQQPTMSNTSTTSSSRQPLAVHGQPPLVLYGTSNGKGAQFVKPQTSKYVSSAGITQGRNNNPKWLDPQMQQTIAQKTSKHLAQMTAAGSHCSIRPQNRYSAGFPVSDPRFRGPAATVKSAPVAVAVVMGSKPLSLADLQARDTPVPRLLPPVRSAGGARILPPNPSVFPRPSIGNVPNYPQQRQPLSLSSQPRMRPNGVKVIRPQKQIVAPKRSDQQTSSAITNGSLTKPADATVINGFYVRSRVWDHETETPELKGRFLCEWPDCDAMFPTNVAYCTHLLAHYRIASAAESHKVPQAVTGNAALMEANDERDEEMTLKHICKCQTCFKEYKTPNQAQRHRQHVHQTAETGSNAPVCFVCELSFVDEQKLYNHILQKHNGKPDIPYWCKYCRFRSSLYDDLWYHFVKEHSHTLQMICPLCLSGFDGKTKNGRSVGSRKTIAICPELVQHMRQHIQRNNPKLNCDRCRLRFIRDADKARHFKMFHEMKSKDGSLSVIPMQSSLRPLPLSRLDDEQKVICGRSRLPARRLIRPAVKPLSVDEAVCIECRQKMSNAAHYKKTSSYQCVMCSFMTQCQPSFENHMLDHAKGTERAPFFHRKEVILATPLRCVCGFETKQGNLLACHLTWCEQSVENGSVAYLRPLSSAPLVLDTVTDGITALDSEEKRTLATKLGRFLRLNVVDRRLSGAGADGQTSTDDDDRNDVDEAVIQVKLKEMEAKTRHGDADAEAVVTPHPQLLSTLSHSHSRRKRKQSPLKSPNPKSAKQSRIEQEETLASISLPVPSTLVPNGRRTSLWIGRRVTAADVGVVFVNHRQKADVLLRDALLDLHTIGCCNGGYLLDFDTSIAVTDTLTAIVDAVADGRTSVTTATVNSSSTDANVPTEEVDFDQFMAAIDGDTDHCIPPASDAVVTDVTTKRGDSPALTEAQIMNGDGAVMDVDDDDDVLILEADVLGSNGDDDSTMNIFSRIGGPRQMSV